MNHHQELLQKIAAGNSTPEERDLLREWLKTLHEQDYRTVLQQYGALLTQQAVEEPYNEALLEKISQAIAAEEKVRHIIPVHHSKWLRYSVAASVLAVALSGWFMLRPGKQAAPTALKTIAPGGNKATLTLANGQQIVLNNAQQGLLSKQGAVQIIKVDSGLLSYRSTGANTEVTYNTITTPRGGQFQVILPDGSRVWLNAASTLRFPTAFTGRERVVALTGEAYFDIAPNAEKPFSVTVENMKVAVLGTSFNIMAYAEEKKISTTLISGSVKVSCDNDQATIIPGHEAVLPEGTKQFQTHEANIAVAVAWKDGKFLFDDTDIHTIMRQVARWYNVDISYEGDLTGVTLSGGISRLQYISQLLDILETTGNVRFKINNNRITVMPAH
jgi:transmembrane sensor